MSVAFSVKPLYTGGDEPYCSLLTIDDFTIMLDCGWDIRKGEDQLEFLREIAPTIKAVVISFPDIEHAGGLPYLIRKIGLTAPIYSTTPVKQLTVLALYDYLQSVNATGFTAFSRDDIDEAMSNITDVVYNAEVEVKGSDGEGLLLSPTKAGHCLGGAIWSFTKEAEVAYYAVNFNHAAETVLDRGLTSVATGNSLFITNARNALVESLPPLQDREKALKKTIRQTLDIKGNVLIPISAVTRSIEILTILNAHWSEYKLLYPLVFLSTTADATLEVAKSLVEWTSTTMQANFSSSRENPLELSHVKTAFSIQQVIDIQRKARLPIVVIATAPHLENSFARELFQMYAKDKKNTILFVERPTVAHDDQFWIDKTYKYVHDPAGNESQSGKSDESKVTNSSKPLLPSGILKGQKAISGSGGSGTSSSSPNLFFPPIVTHTQANAPLSAPPSVSGSTSQSQPPPQRMYEVPLILQLFHIAGVKCAAIDGIYAAESSSNKKDMKDMKDMKDSKEQKIKNEKQGETQSESESSSKVLSAFEKVNLERQTQALDMLKRSKAANTVFLTRVQRVLLSQAEKLHMQAQIIKQEQDKIALKAQKKAQKKAYKNVLRQMRMKKTTGSAYDEYHDDSDDGEFDDYDLFDEIGQLDDIKTSRVRGDNLNPEEGDQKFKLRRHRSRSRVGMNVDVDLDLNTTDNQSGRNAKRALRKYRRSQKSSSFGVGVGVDGEPSPISDPDSASDSASDSSVGSGSASASSASSSEDENENNDDDDDIASLEEVDTITAAFTHLITGEIEKVTSQLHGDSKNPYMNPVKRTSQQQQQDNTSNQTDIIMSAFAKRSKNSHFLSFGWNYTPKISDNYGSAPDLLSIIYAAKAVAQRPEISSTMSGYVQLHVNPMSYFTDNKIPFSSAAILGNETIVDGVSGDGTTSTSTDPSHLSHDITSRKMAQSHLMDAADSTDPEGGINPLSRAVLHHKSAKPTSGGICGWEGPEEQFFTPSSVHLINSLALKNSDIVKKVLIVKGKQYPNVGFGPGQTLSIAGVSQSELTNTDGTSLSSNTNLTNIDKKNTSSSSSSYTMQNSTDPAFLSHLPNTKLVSTKMPIEVEAKVLFIDFEGLSDGPSIRNVIRRFAPRAVVILNGSVNARNTLCTSLRSRITQSGTNIFVPAANINTIISIASKLIRFTISDQLASYLNFVPITTTKSGDYITTGAGAGAGAATTAGTSSTTSGTSITGIKSSDAASGASNDSSMYALAATAVRVGYDPSSNVPVLYPASSTLVTVSALAANSYWNAKIAELEEQAAKDQEINAIKISSTKQTDEKEMGEGKESKDSKDSRDSKTRKSKDGKDIKDTKSVPTLANDPDFGWTVTNSTIDISSTSSSTEPPASTASTSTAPTEKTTNTALQQPSILSVATRRSIFLGSLRLNDLQTIIAQHGIPAFIRAGVLYCGSDGLVIVKANPVTGFVVDGVLNETLFQVRDILYEQFQIA